MPFELQKQDFEFLQALKEQVEKAKGDVNAMVMAQYAVGNAIEDFGIDIIKKYVDTEQFYRDVGKMAGELEVEMLKAPTTEMYKVITELRADATWDAQYQNVGRFIEEGRQAVVKEHPEVRMNSVGEIINAPFNPLVLKSSEIDLILANKQARGEFPSADAPVGYMSIDQAIQEFAQTTKDIMMDVDQNLWPPTPDFHVSYTSPAVERRAMLLATFRDYPEIMAELDAADKKVYEEPEVQNRVAEQASSGRSYATLYCMQEFATKHDIEIPDAEWKQSADLNRMRNTQDNINRCLGDAYQMAIVMPEVTQLMDEIDRATLEQHVNLAEYWQDVGRQVADLEMQKASDPLYFAEDALLYQLRAPMNWPEQGEFIAEHICAGREEVLRANPHAWCDIVATNVQQDKEFQVYPEASFSEVVKLLENVPLATIQEHFQGNPDFDIEKYLQECGRAIQHKFIDAFFEMDVEQAQQKEGIGDFIRQHVSAGMNELAQSQDIEDRFQ